MPPKLGDKKTKPTSKTAGEFQRSKVISSYGPGAIVDFPRFSGIMAGLDSWNISDPNNLPPGLLDDSIFFERNLSELLKKKFFVQVTTDDNAPKKYSLRTYRFPSYYYCPKCHQLDYYRKIALPDNSSGNNVNSLLCNNCSVGKSKVQLIPSRFIIACPNGHIDDFPYSWWVHRGQNTNCEKPQLSLQYIGNTGGLDSIVISCKCGAKATMQGCMDKNALKGLACKSTMPWLGFDADTKRWYSEKQECSATMRTMQRSANNVYYPVKASVLTIPPWSAKIVKIFEKKKDVLNLIFSLPESMQESYLKKHYEECQNQYKCSWNTFKKECYKYFCNEDRGLITEQSLRIDEYNAFCGEDNTSNDDYFKTQSTEVPEELQPYIDQIKIVRRLREVSALRGFRRIDPANEESAEARAEGGLFNREFTPISKSELDWLPAIQMYGEGIFIKFNEQSISEWEKVNSERYKKLAVRKTMAWIGNGMFNAKEPRFVLLHTFAHLLIRQLISQCGYETASLRERIYSTYVGNDEKMAGVLIYTSSTDGDGSLGGLAREGEGYRLCNTIFSMIDAASWCSNDPICIESEGQGFKGLSYAACHACTLLPETSCESANCLLDRASIVGLPSNKKCGYFADLL